MKKLLKKSKFLHKMIHSLHQSYIDHKHTNEYIHADDIKIHYKKKGDIYLIYEYKGTQGLMAQMEGVLTWVKYAVDHNFILVVDMTDNSNLYQMNDENAWENFYYQPMLEISADKAFIARIKKTENYAMAPIYDRASYLWRKNYVKPKIVLQYPPTIIHPSTRDYYLKPEVQHEFERLYQEYIRFKPNVADYLEKEYSTLVKDRGEILGVILRGTDYTAQKPYMHPIQPSLDIVLGRIELLRAQNKWQYIYLATDEKRTEDLFKNKYKDKVITNKRNYYESNDYDKVPVRDIHINRENDSYLRGLEYLSSMYILSRCNLILGGLCGGSQAAILMNCGCYKEIDLFDLGNYGIDDINQKDSML